MKELKVKYTKIKNDILVKTAEIEIDKKNKIKIMPLKEIKTKEVEL
jgi:hypothetical protein